MTTDRIYVDKNLNLLIETDGPGASVGMMDRELVRARAADVLKALRQVAERDCADLSNVNVGIAGGTLSYADVEAMMGMGGKETKMIKVEYETQYVADDSEYTVWARAKVPSERMDTVTVAGMVKGEKRHREILKRAALECLRHELDTRIAEGWVSASVRNEIDE